MTEETKAADAASTGVSDSTQLLAATAVNFVQGVLSNAKFLRDCFDNLSEAEANAVANKLETCAELIERLELQNEELLLRQDLLDSKPSPTVCRAMARFWVKMADRTDAANKR